jgi:hypothetical protein
VVALLVEDVEDVEGVGDDAVEGVGDLSPVSPVLVEDIPVFPWSVAPCCPRSCPVSPEPMSP